MMCTAWTQGFLIWVSLSIFCTFSPEKTNVVQY